MKIARGATSTGTDAGGWHILAHSRTTIVRDRAPQPSALPKAADDSLKMGLFCHFRVRTRRGTFRHISAVWATGAKCNRGDAEVAENKRGEEKRRCAENCPVLTSLARARCPCHN